jgi:ATP-binding cassette subfamily B protein
MDRKYKDKDLIKKMLKYLHPERKKIIISLILTLFSVLISLLSPMLQGRVVGILAYNNPQELENAYGINSGNFNNDKFMVIAIMISIFILALIIAAFIGYHSQMLLQRAGQNMVYRVRNDVFTKIESYSIKQINKEPIGKFVTRVTNDTTALSDLCTNTLVNLIKYFITIVAVLIIMFILDYRLSLLMLILIPILFVVTYVFRHFSRRAHREVRTNLSQMNSYLSENISGIKITQIFNQEEKQLDKFNECNTLLKKSYLKDVLVFSIFRPLIYFIYILTQVLVLLVGHKTMPLQDMVSYYYYVQNLFNPIQSLADQFNSLQASFASLEKIFTILDQDIDIVDKEGAIDVKKLKGDIEFRHVWFAYNDENWILKDVSFKVNAGDTVALVGATGAGKTTILGLIVRNYEIQKGEILIDGININDISINTLRQNIGQMLQDVFLFSGTIRDNLTLRDKSIQDDRVIEASRYVYANHIIDKFSDGLDHKIEERGQNFSQGERQLLSFARTVVYNPNIMILDEATANIDTETEQLIQQSLNRMMSIGTMLIVAHRLSTIQHADKIIVMSHGEIKEEGNHQELLKKKGMYYNLYTLQYKDYNHEK